jgi:hypothetical protein
MLTLANPTGAGGATTGAVTGPAANLFSSNSCPIQTRAMPRCFQEQITAQQHSSANPPVTSPGLPKLWYNSSGHWNFNNSELIWGSCNRCKFDDWQTERGNRDNWDNRCRRSYRGNRHYRNNELSWVWRNSRHNSNDRYHRGSGIRCNNRSDCHNRDGRTQLWCGNPWNGNRCGNYSWNGNKYCRHWDRPWSWLRSRARRGYGCIAIWCNSSFCPIDWAKCWRPTCSRPFCANNQPVCTCSRGGHRSEV